MALVVTLLRLWRRWFPDDLSTDRLRRDIAMARRGVRPAHWPIVKFYRARAAVSLSVWMRDDEFKPDRAPSFTMERIWPMPWGQDTTPVAR